MKTLALDLDSGRLSRWIGDSREFAGWSDRYGDLYTLRVHVYSSAGRKVPSCSLQLLVKRPRRRDVKALWDLGTFARVPSMIAPNFATYVGQVSVTGEAYREALKLDASPGNDLPKFDFLGVLRVVTSSGVVESEFDYEVVNSGFRPNDSNLGSVYIGVSETGSLLVRSISGAEWRELLVAGTGAGTTFAVGGTALGPVEQLTLDEDFVRVENGVLQIKNDDNNQWVNLLMSGPGGASLTLGDTPAVGFSLSDERFKVGPEGRLLLRNITTGNWHEARIQLADGVNVLALGDEYDDSQV